MSKAAAIKKHADPCVECQRCRQPMNPHSDYWDLAQAALFPLYELRGRAHPRAQMKGKRRPAAPQLAIRQVEGKDAACHQQHAPPCAQFMCVALRISIGSRRSRGAD